MLINYIYLYNYYVIYHNGDGSITRFKCEFSFKFMEATLDNARTLEEMTATLLVNINSLEPKIVYNTEDYIIIAVESLWNEELKLKSFELVRDRIIKRENEGKDRERKNKEAEEENNRKKKKEMDDKVEEEWSKRNDDRQKKDKNKKNDKNDKDANAMKSKIVVFVIV